MIFIQSTRTNQSHDFKFSALQKLRPEHRPVCSQPGASLIRCSWVLMVDGWWFMADGWWLTVDGWLIASVCCVDSWWLQGRASRRTLSVTWQWRSVSSPTPWWWRLAGTPCCWVGGVQGGSENYHNATRDQAIFWTIYISTFLFKNTVCIQVFPILNSTLKAISCYNSATRIILVHSVFFFVKFLIPVFNIFCLIVPTSIV